MLLPKVMLRQGAEGCRDDTPRARPQTWRPVPIELLSGADDLVAACLGTPRGGA